jgi:hypothetical protein
MSRCPLLSHAMGLLARALRLPVDSAERAELLDECLAVLARLATE